MARKANRSKNEQLRGGEIVGEKVERVELEGSCDRDITVISQTNNSGNIDTLHWPKNTGTCGDFVIIRCLDQNKQPIAGTDVWLRRGKSIKSYASPPTAHSIVFFCPDPEEGGAAGWRSTGPSLGRCGCTAGRNRAPRSPARPR